MAKAYERPNSRFWWVRYRDPGTGKIVRKSTGLDIIAPNAKNKAAEIAAKWHVKEMAAPRTTERERWETWAGLYIEDRYKDAEGSLRNARIALKELMVYFQEVGIRTPVQVDYDIAAGFVPWRTSGRKLKKITANSACLRFVYFSVLMGEAVRRGFAEFNHCRSVENKRTAPKEKVEISKEDQVKIETDLIKKPEWMQDCWRVLMCQGCRIAEVAVPMERIDTETRTITFRLKGGKMHTAALHPELLPLVKKAKDAGRKFLVEGPPVGSWSTIWHDFFRRRKLPYSIHCTRVTAITRMVRAGHTVPAICNFIGHGEEVNRIYRKLKPDDSRALLGSLGGVSIPL